MKRVKYIFWAILFALILGNGFAQNLLYKKTDKFRKPKEHPFQKYLVHPDNKKIRAAKPNIERNKVLVILVDFQEDDTPETTGNGKFLLDGSDYPVYLGKPPHDKAYYEELMQAAHHYYKAASHGGFDLQYDVFPHDKTAYTLPNEMKYYNPGMDDQALFVSRIEDFFRHAFEEADKDENITFANYDHFIIIHAGSDWQHDINADSPHDLPTVHVALQPSAVIPVDNGDTLISYAISIPEMTTQDIQEYVDEAGDKTYSGYGFPTSSIVHEFGHSLGLVDIYNTSNNYPSVGYFDIMDSGGNGILLTADEEGNYYEFEGAVPGLPGAWSRLLLWGEDYYRNLGSLKNIDALPFDKNIAISPIGKFYNENDPQLFMVKVPLNDHEYLLIENRQVNPYGEVIAFKGALEDDPALTNTYRVISYPILYDGDEDLPVYGYDYLLPGFVELKNTSDGLANNYFGGGLLFWHIDNQRLYDEGVVQSDGTFISNFNLNRINPSMDNRAVKIIEADGLSDLGDPYSFYWHGTAYEAFYAHLPRTENGYFQGWSDEIHQTDLAASTTPALRTNDGEPVLYRFYDISDSNLTYDESTMMMTFKIGASMFDYTQPIDMGSNLTSEENFVLGAVGSTSESYSAGEIATIYPSHTVYYTHFYDEEQNQDYWATVKPDFQQQAEPDFPVLTHDFDHDGNDDFFCIDDNFFLLYNSEHENSFSFETNITATPVAWENGNELFYAIPTEQKLYIESVNTDFSVEFPIKDGEIYYVDHYLISQTENYAYIIDLDDLTKQPVTVYIPHTTTKTKLASFYDTASEKLTIFTIGENGDVYKIENNQAEVIFSLANYELDSHSQLAISYDQTLAYHFLVFGGDNLVFATDFDGNLLSHFPQQTQDLSIAPYSDIRAIQGRPMIQSDNSIDGYEPTLHYFTDVNDGYFVYDSYGNFKIEYSLYWKQNGHHTQFYWEAQSERLYFVYVGSDNQLFVSYNRYNGCDDNPIYWNGYKNGFYGSTSGILNMPQEITSEFDIYAYPNPAKNFVKIGIEGVLGDVDINIYDVAGNLIHKGSQSVVSTATRTDYKKWNIRGLSSGVYFIVAKHNGNVKKTKVMIIK